MRVFPGILAAILGCGLASHVHPVVAGDDSDPFELLSDPAAGSAELAVRLGKHAPLLASSSGTATSRKGIVACSAGGEAEREDLLDRVDRALQGAGEVLHGLGLESPPRPALTVVMVDHRGGLQDVVARSGDALLLRVRRGDAGSGTAVDVPAPTAPSRPDGPPVLRDHRALAQGILRWRIQRARDAAAVGGGNSLEDAVVSMLLSRGILTDSTPPWVGAGLRSLIALRVRGLDPTAAPLHVSGSALDKDGAAAATWTTEPVGPGGGPVVTRAVLDLLGGRSGEEAGRVLRAMLAGDTAGAGLADGGDARLLKDAAKGLASTGGICDATARIPCPACAGRTLAEVDCPDCDGGGAVVCPSCMGLDECWTGCEDGRHYFEGGHVLPCRYCSRGKISCKACKAKSVVPCTTCRGKGRITFNCPQCVGGSLACPSCTGGDCASCKGKGKLPCTLCTDRRAKEACSVCRGAAYAGCNGCYGMMKSPCPRCMGAGKKIMVYTDGTVASASSCDGCGGVGVFACRKCKNGRLPCNECDSKGVVERSAASCGLCTGSGERTCPDCGLPDPPPRAAGLTAEEVERQRQVIDKARRFLYTSVGKGGAFTLRKKGTDEAAGALSDPTLYSNASILWVLLSTGEPADNPVIVKALRELRNVIDHVIDGTNPEAGVQACAFALRTLLMTGDAGDRDRAEKLVKVLEKAQKSSGLWVYGIDGKDDNENILNSLIAVEAIYVAHRSGIKVQGATWSRAYKAGSAAFGSRGPSSAKDGGVSAIEVLSNLSLIVFAKAGSLGDRAGAFDYLSLPDVQTGLQWLDRHMDIRDHPEFVKGARVHHDKGGAYFAYLFSLQRLAQMLRLESVGGESWFTAGARHVVELQRADGSFEERGIGAANWSVRSTGDALTFLLRVTPPVTDGR